MIGSIQFPVTSTRLTIRPLILADAPSLHQLYSDAVAMQYLTSDVPTTLEESRAWVQAKMDLHDETGLSLWAVVLTASDEVIGDAGLQLLEDGETVEVGVRIVRRLWGRGYGAEASRAVMEAGFRDLGLERIVGLTDPGNERAIRAMEAAGMTHIGLEEHYGKSWTAYEAVHAR